MSKQPKPAAPETDRPQEKPRGILAGLQSVDISFGNAKERDAFLENISLLVGSGMSVIAALDTLAEEMQSHKMKKTLAKMRADIDAGGFLWQTMEESRMFSPYTISLVRIGEESGKLTENLRAVADHQAKDRVFRAQLKSAMSYPVLVMVLAIVIGSAVAWFILPKLSDVFSQMRIKLPLTTRVLISLGDFLEKHGIVAIPLFLFVTFGLLYVLFLAPKTKRVGQSLLFRTPGIKQLLQEVELARFGYLLGSMMDAGLSVTKALRSLATATPFQRYERFYVELERLVHDGYSFQQAFTHMPEAKRLLPGPVRQLIVAGERSGSLSQTMLSIGRTYEQKTEISAKNLTVMLEPILLIVVWLAVVGVALGVILPVYSLIGGLRGS